MSLKMVCANFRNPSLHLLEQPLMVAEGRQARLSAPRREGCHLAGSWNSEPAWANPESWTHPRRSGNSTAASAASPASASTEPAGHDARSLPRAPLHPFLLSTRVLPTGGAQAARAQGALRTEQESGAGREALERSQAWLSLFATRQWQWSN